MANNEYTPGNPMAENETQSGSTISNTRARVQEQVTAYGQKAVEAIDARRQSAASGLANAAEGLRAKAEELPSGKVAGMAHQTADGLRSTADYLREHDMSDMARDAQDFVKAHPFQALLGAAVVGFLAGRAARS